MKTTTAHHNIGTRSTRVLVFLLFYLFTFSPFISAQDIPEQVMQAVYQEVRTPYKYGLVVAPTDNYHKIDCPTVFRMGDKWLMTYVVYNGKDGLDGRGYETWLATSDDLLTWTTEGRLLSYPTDIPAPGASPTDTARWDANQRGGFPALIDWTWGGSYELGQYKGRHWMTYIGGHGTGYEAVREPLNIGLAWTQGDPATAHEWQTLDRPLMSIHDRDAQWWERLVQYKSTVYDLRAAAPLPRQKESAAVPLPRQKESAAALLPSRGGVRGGVSNPLPPELRKHRFLMFYNAGGINPANDLKAERIGIALSNDMKHWKRYPGNPVYFHESPGIITGDAQIVRVDSLQLTVDSLQLTVDSLQLTVDSLQLTVDSLQLTVDSLQLTVDSSTSASQLSTINSQLSTPLYVMFYFSAYNPDRKYNAYNTFAVSRDLVHWQDWTGPDLIWPTKPYDDMFAHKSYVLKHDGVVYHFYCAVNNAQQRGIAVATSVPMGRSQLRFPQPEPTGRRTLTPLNDGWQARIVHSSQSTIHSPNDDAQPTINCQLSTINSIALPHNFDDYYGYRQLRHGNLHGSAIYNKVFQATKKDSRRYFLQFEGVGTYATVTLNGHQYPRELVGRTVWTLDVTDALRDGQNDLSVLVDHPAMQTASPWVCGGCSSEWGFSEGSQPFGIFRPVTLVETDPVRIEPFGVHIWNNPQCDTVFIDTEVRNYTSEPQTVELVNKFTLASGKQVFRLAERLTLAPGELRTHHCAHPVPDAHRWSLTDPYLYTLATMLKRDTARASGGSAAATVTTDELRTPFGIRTLSWPGSVGRATSAASASSGSVGRGIASASAPSGPSPSGPVGRANSAASAPAPAHRFLLNGSPVFINGTCEYEHLLGASHAFSPEQIRSRVKQIRNAGFNAFREAHQPHNLLYQQLFDEQGLLFWSQFSAHIWYDTPEFRQNFKRLLTRWIRERRNSPSVIMWGLQNESVLPRDFAEECTALIRQLDPTASTMRPVTTCNGGEGTDWNVIQNWSGTYGGSADNYADELRRPDQLLNGEYGAWRTLDLHGPAKYSEESFTALLQKKARLAEHAFLAAQPLPAPSGSVGRATSAASAPVPSPAPPLPSLQGEGSGVGSETPLGVCGHFQWLFASHDNPGRVQPDGALRRIDKIGPINYKGLTTIWEEPTPAYYMYRNLSLTLPQGEATLPGGHSPSSADGSVNCGITAVPTAPLPTAADRNRALLKPAEGYHYLYRINCGGDAYVDEYGQQWQADDSIVSHSWGQDFPGIHPFQASQRHTTAPVHGTQSPDLFQFFRFGRHRLWYDLPVPAVSSATVPSAPSLSGPVGRATSAASAASASAPTSVGSPSPLYRIELYFMEPWHGRDVSETADYEGLRIFDVAVNDSVVIDDLDPWAEAGYCGALKRVVYAPARDGRLRISFPEVKAGQAVICAIAVAVAAPSAIAGAAAVPSAVAGAAAASAVPSVDGPVRRGIASATWRSLDTDTIARLPKSELPHDTEARPATVYQPIKERSTFNVQRSTFLITPGLGQEYALRFKYKNTTASPVRARMTITDAKRTVLVDRDVTFPPTPNKFKTLSTTTGTQINAGTYTVRIDTRDVEFKELEIQ